MEQECFQEGILFVDTIYGLGEPRCQLGEVIKSNSNELLIKWWGEEKIEDWNIADFGWLFARGTCRELTLDQEGLEEFKALLDRAEKDWKNVNEMDLTFPNMFKDYCLPSLKAWEIPVLEGYYRLADALLRQKRGQPLSTTWKEYSNTTVYKASESTPPGKLTNQDLGVQWLGVEEEKEGKLYLVGFNFHTTSPDCDYGDSYSYKIKDGFLICIHEGF